MRGVLGAGGSLYGSRTYPFDWVYTLHDSIGRQVGDLLTEHDSAQLVEDGVVSFRSRDAVVATLLDAKPVVEGDPAQLDWVAETQAIG